MAKDRIENPRAVDPKHPDRLERHSGTGYPGTAKKPEREIDMEIEDGKEEIVAN